MGLFDYFTGGNGVADYPQPEGDMSVYGRTPGPGLTNLAGGGGGFMDNLGRSLNNPVTQMGLALASGHTPQEGFGNVVKAQLARQKTEADKWPSSVKEYQYAVATGQFKGTYPEFVQQQQQAQERYGVTPVPIQDENGTVIGWKQFSTMGNVKDQNLPEGQRPALKNRVINQGDRQVIVPGVGSPVSPAPFSPATGTLPDGTPAPQPGVFPNNVDEVARQKATGKAQGEQQARLPAVESNADRMIKQLNELEKHPGMESATGFAVGKSPIALTPNARDFISRADQLLGESWTMGVQAVRGSGAISDAEGKRLEQANSRLRVRDVKTEDYRQAIKDVKEITETARKNARLIAAGKMKPYPVDEAPSAPQGARQAPDGNYYVPDPHRPGKYLQIVQ